MQIKDISVPVGQSDENKDIGLILPADLIQARGCRSTTNSHMQDQILFALKM